MNDKVLKRIMLSYGRSADTANHDKVRKKRIEAKDKMQLAGSLNYDILADREHAQRYQYVPFY